MSAHDRALNQSNTIQLPSDQINIKYQTIILQVSYYSSSIISTANETIIQTACKSSYNISAHDCALNQSTYSSTNNYSNKYQLPNHDLASLLQLKQHYIYCKSLNKFSISIQTACKSSHNISAHDCALNQLTYRSTNNCSKYYQLQYIILLVFSKSISIMTFTNDSISSAPI